MPKVKEHDGKLEMESVVGGRVAGVLPSQGNDGHLENDCVLVQAVVDAINVLITGVILQVSYIFKDRHLK